MFKKTKEVFFLVIIILFFNNCVKEVGLDKVSSKKKLIVESSITNENKNQIVILSNSYDFDKNKVKYETKAKVFVVEDGNNIYNFIEKKPGHYQSINKFQAKEKSSYVLKIQTLNGRKYSSTPEKMNGKSDIDSVKIRKTKNNDNEDGLGFSVTSKNTSKNAKYFKYDFIETYKIVVPYWSKYKIEVINKTKFIVVEKDSPSTRVCYKTLNSNTIIQTETSALSKRDVNLDFLFYLKNDFKIQHRYSMLLTQRVQSKNAYKFYEVLNKISKNENVFSYNQPGNITGNIKPENNEGEVFGFFEVNYISKKRIFFNFKDLYPNSEPTFISKCYIITPKIILYTMAGPEYPIYDNLTGSNYVFYSHNSNLSKPFKLVNSQCADCRMYGSIAKPNFWID